MAFNSCTEVVTAIPNYQHMMPELIVSDTVVQSDVYMPLQNAEVASVEDETLASYDPGVQWQLDTIGVKSAWDKSFVGSETIRVGVLDTGIDTDHPEFDNNVDWSLAYNAVTENIGMQYVEDTHGHGTVVSGIIAADLDGIGMSGLCPNVTLVPIKIGDGFFNDMYVENAINHAVANDIQILNISYAIQLDEYEYLQTALAKYNGILVVAAGNMGTDMENDSFSTGKINDDENWFVVGAVGENNMKYSTSNYSEIYCDIFAPGEGIMAPTLDGGYGTFAQSSVAAPHIAAAIALIASKATHLSLIEIKDLLMDTAIQSAFLEDYCVCDGRLSIINAVNYLYSENRGAYTLGDATGDGYVTTDDSTLIRQFVLGSATPTNTQARASDVNQDSVINAQDYMMTRRFALGTYYFPPE